MPIIKKTLSEKLTANLAAGRYSDAATPGLRLEVGKRARTFSVVYRRGSKTETLKIGRVDQGVTLKQAREKAADVQDQLAAGIDPKMPLGRDASAPTIAITFGRAWEQYKNEYLSTKRTGKSEAEFVDLHALDHFAPRLMASITKREAGEFMRATQKRIAKGVNAREKAKGRPPKDNAGHYTVKNLLKRLKAFYNWAIRVDLVDFNPFERIALELSTPSRKRVLSVDEILTVLDAVRLHDSPAYRNIISMIVSTGMRAGEVVELRFGWMNLDSGFASIPAHIAKNGRINHVALPDHAVSDLRRISANALSVVGNQDELKGAYVYTSGNNKRYWNFGKDKEKLNALLPEVFEPFTLHDLRRSVATALQTLGVSRDVIERGILRHLPTGDDALMQTYQLHEYVPEAIRALNQWNAFLYRRALELDQMQDAERLNQKAKARHDKQDRDAEIENSIRRAEQWANDNPAEYAAMVRDNAKLSIGKSTIVANPLSQTGWGVKGGKRVPMEVQKEKARLRKQASRARQKAE